MGESLRGFLPKAAFAFRPEEIKKKRGEGALHAVIYREPFNYVIQIEWRYNKLIDK